MSDVRNDVKKLLGDDWGGKIYRLYLDENKELCVADTELEVPKVDKTSNESEPDTTIEPGEQD